jgi:hypothetical protein
MNINEMELTAVDFSEEEVLTLARLDDVLVKNKEALKKRLNAERAAAVHAGAELIGYWVEASDFSPWDLDEDDERRVNLFKAIPASLDDLEWGMNTFSERDTNLTEDETQALMGLFINLWNHEEWLMKRLSDEEKAGFKLAEKLVDSWLKKSEYSFGFETV